MMRMAVLIPVPALLAVPHAMALGAQEIVKIPAKDAPTVVRPDDLFQLPPGQWHFAKQLWAGNEPCDAQNCEAGYTSGDLVVSVERSEKDIRLIAGLRHCEAVGFSEMEPGNKLGKSESKRIAKQVKNVVKGVAKSCGATAPDVPALDVARLFPAKVEAK